MKKIIKDWFTEPDNNTYCMTKFLSFWGAICFLVYAGIHVLNNHVFDYQAFGVGFGALMTGCGACLMLKKDTKNEPN